MSQATTKATTPAATPASIPRMSRLLAMTWLPRLRPGSVAGEAEQVPAVVHELVHPRPGQDRGGALFRAHEVDQQRAHDEREDRPGQQLAQRDDRQCGGRRIGGNAG